MESGLAGGLATGPHHWYTLPMASERNFYTVARLNREVRPLLEQGPRGVWVEGEMSTLTRPSSGHWHFSLQDRYADSPAPMRDCLKHHARLWMQPPKGTWEIRGLQKHASAALIVPLSRFVTTRPRN